MNQSYSRFLTITGLVGVVLIQTACSNSDNTAGGKLTVVDRTTQALVSATVVSVSGVYSAACLERDVGIPWTVTVADPQPANALTVVLNNQACVLTVTDVNVTGSGDIGTADDILLTDEFAAEASLFTLGAVQFYANAQLSAVDFADDFGLTLLHSNDPSLLTSTNTAQFAVTESNATAVGVPAPAVVLTMTGVEVTVDVADEFVAADGNATVVDTTGAGTRTYVVSEALLVDANTYAEIDALYIDGTEAALGDIPAAAFSLNVAEEMPQTRQLIIANDIDGVRSYTVFTITFNGAAG